MLWFQARWDKSRNHINSNKFHKETKKKKDVVHWKTRKDNEKVSSVLGRKLVGL